MDSIALSELDILHMRTVLPGERRRACEQGSRLVGRYESRQQLSLQKRLILDLPRDGIDIGADHHQSIVEVMHDAVPEPLHGFRFLLRRSASSSVERSLARNLLPAADRPLPFGKGRRSRADSRMKVASRPRNSHDHQNGKAATIPKNTITAGATNPVPELNAAATTNRADATRAATRAVRGNREWNCCGSMVLTNNCIDEAPGKRQWRRLS